MRRYFFAGAVAACGLLSVALSNQAQAITLDLVLNDITTVPTTSLGPQAFDFNLGATVDLVTPPPDSIGGVYRSPWQGTGFENLGYTSVRNGTAGYNITATSLSLFWGSADDYNTLTFFTGQNATGASVSITGSLLDLGPLQTTGHHLVHIVTSEVFRSVTFSSLQPAFEFANMVTPIPAALPLFATGLGLMGWLARRRKRGHAAIAA